MNGTNWNVTQKRFVSFFDILGFKDMVFSHTHDQVLTKLTALKSTLSFLELASNSPGLKELKIDDDQTRSVTFSDSIMFFSKSDTENDAIKIIYDSYALIRKATENDIPIKGAIAFGQITLNFNKSIFFGKPIIEAYLLHEELQLMTAILHHSFEAKLQNFNGDFWAFVRNSIITEYRVILKSARVSHTIMRPHDTNYLWIQIQSLKKQLLTVSGRGRLYIDNTLDFLLSLDNRLNKP